MPNSKMPSKFKWLAFLALIRWSQVHNSVTNTKLKLFKVGELAFISSRYRTEAMNKIHGSILLPVVGNRNALNLRLFTFAHVDGNPLHNFAASSLIVWACMGLYRLVWACMGLYGLVWASLGLFGLRWALLVWACPGLPGLVRACLGWFGLV